MASRWTCAIAKRAGPLSTAQTARRTFASHASNSSAAARAHLKNAPETNVTTLGNGLRVASEQMDTETATIGVWIDAGSRFESEKTNGAAHFLEHMSFKGTEKRTQHALELEIENMGGHLNAYTSREQTVYYAKVFKKDVPRAIDILSDILQHSKLAEANVERERDVILREAEEVSKQMDEVVFDHLHATAYQGTSLGRTILGPTENINSLTRNDLKSYIAQNYLAPRMCVVAAGGVRHDEVCKLSEAAFGKLPTSTGSASSSASATLPFVAEPARFTGSEVRLKDSTMAEAHFAIAVEGCSWQSADHIPLLLIQAIVGSWDRTLGAGANVSSRLAQAVQDEKLGNSFMSFNTSYTDSGLFGVYFTTANAHDMDDLTYVMFREWVRIAMSCTEADLQRAKNQLKTSLLLQLDGTTPVAEEIGRQLLTYGQRIPPAQMEAMIDAVDVKTIRRVGQKYLYDRDIAVAAVGNIDSLPDYNHLRAYTNMSRY